MKGKSELANTGTDVLSDGCPSLLHYIATPSQGKEEKASLIFLKGLRDKD